jgi:hypothetical protein
LAVLSEAKRDSELYERRDIARSAQDNTRTDPNNFHLITYNHCCRDHLWSNVTAAKPVSYYISLLKSAGVQPYVELGWELQALPDATNATTVAKITYLALNATNPEVKEAFQLMMNGGTPNQGDFKYTVPSWNTQLEVLYWLATQNNIKKDDALALAVAMSNGIWVAIGDGRVR